MIEARKQEYDPTIEAARLECVHASQVVARSCVKQLTGICELARLICDVPEACIKLVYDSRVVSIANSGPKFVAVDRQNAFSTHADLKNDVFIVENAAKDDRFKNHPLVVVEGGVRFYAGAPLVCRHGHALGALCAFDQRARSLSETQISGLRLLSEQAAGLLHVSDSVTEAIVESNRQLQEAQRHLGNVSACAPIIMLAVDENGVIRQAQGPSIKHLCPDDDLVGRRAEDAFRPYPELLFGFSEAIAGREARQSILLGTRTFESHFSATTSDFVDAPCVYAMLFDATERQELEEKLMIAEKQETIGLLASGIAHEINSPMQFISDNIDFLHRAFVKLERFISRQMLMLEVSSDSDLEIDKKALSEIAEQIRLSYLVEQIPLALQQSLEGVERVVGISTSMREMSHRGNEEFAPTDINRAINTSLAVTRSEYKYVADIQLALDNDLPLISCQSWEIKQVLVNLIINAAHAISDCVTQGKYARGEITVRTQIEVDELVISVEDNGGGIPDELRDSVFLPFFTTKPPGKGTGQGLALARTIVESKHRGKLELYSWPDEGTTFIIRLPIPIDADTAEEVA